MRGLPLESTKGRTAFYRRDVFLEKFFGKLANRKETSIVELGKILFVDKSPLSGNCGYTSLITYFTRRMENDPWGSGAPNQAGCRRPNHWE
jgi:hypothetical protein